MSAGAGVRRRDGPLRAPRHDVSAVGPLLAVEGIEVSYGPLQILFGVDLQVLPGEAVALLGTNGAGKSTLLKVIGGLLRPERGSVTFDGRDVTRLPAEERVPLGITLVEGGKAMFPSLTVEENLRLGAYVDLDDRDAVRARVDRALEVFPPLRDLLGRLAGTLSGGQQQMVAIGRAVVADGRLLVVDELSLGLAPVVMEQIVRAVEQLLGEGRAVLLVEQSLNVALGLTQRAYFMEKGQVRFSGPTADLLDRGDLVRSVFFGGAP